MLNVICFLKLVPKQTSFWCFFFPLQVGYDMSRSAARKCYEATGLKPSDVDVVELHDCFSANELITYEALGLCPEGETAALKTLRYPPSYFKTWLSGQEWMQFPEFEFLLLYIIHKICQD